MIDEKTVQRNQWILITLIFLSLGANLLFILSGSIDLSGKFGGSEEVPIECAIPNLSIRATGETYDAAATGVKQKMVDYAHLFCNGKFKDDPDSVSIVGLGCPSCKPDCLPKIMLESDMDYSPGKDGIQAFQNVSVTCF